MPVSIPECFENIARDEPRGKDQKWHTYFIFCDMVDIDKSRRDHPVCKRPTSEVDWEYLAAKTKWLRPYASDPFVEDIVRQLDQALLDSEYRPTPNDPESSKDA